jgi:glycosyltransferase involved in cell wall biosynthesis
MEEKTSHLPAFAADMTSMHHGGPLSQPRGTWNNTGKLSAGYRSALQANTTQEPAPGNRPLRGLRLVVTSFDLQQVEHRGIAVFSKALLRALKQSGAELWLLTDFDPPLWDSGLKRVPATVQKLVYEARVLDALATGYGGPLSPWASMKLAQSSKWLRKLIQWRNNIREFFDKVKLRRRYKLARLPKLSLHDLYDSPYQRLERLSYFDELDGIISAKYLYLNVFRSALGKRPKPVVLELDGFDGLVTTAPMNLSVRGPGCFVQTVHDLIPLEYVSTTDHVGVFSQRMMSTIPARKLFVSGSAQTKFQITLPNRYDAGGSVVIQPPSLSIPEPINRAVLTQDVLKPSRRAKAKHASLQAFRYLLFNSSVEPRKHLLFVIKAYRLSGLAELGIRLCVTGQLKPDAYSKAVAEQADESVLLTGYVDETTKANLFLHALGVLSPSLVEGFGIPVLDAACIGAATMASPSASHLEIQRLHDFDERIWICDTRDPVVWARSMHVLCTAEMERIGSNAEERMARLKRYDKLNQEICENFRSVVCDEVLNSLQGRSFKSGMADGGVRG